MFTRFADARSELRSSGRRALAPNLQVGSLDCSMFSSMTVLDMFSLMLPGLRFSVAVSLFLSFCLVCELASRLERNFGIMDVASVANACFHPMLSGIDTLFRPCMPPTLQSLSIWSYLREECPNRKAPRVPNSESSSLFSWADLPRYSQLRRQLTNPVMKLSPLQYFL